MGKHHDVSTVERSNPANCRAGFSQLLLAWKRLGIYLLRQRGWMDGWMAPGYVHQNTPKTV